MGQATLPFTVVLASVVLASAIIYAARMIASAIAQHTEVLQSDAGFSVEASGVPVESETLLETGSTVLAFSQGRWWRAEVTAVEGVERVRIHYLGWDPTWDESVPRSVLQVDLGAAAEDWPPQRGG